MVYLTNRTYVASFLLLRDEGDFPLTVRLDHKKREELSPPLKSNLTNSQIRR